MELEPGVDSLGLAELKENSKPYTCPLFQKLTCHHLQSSTINLVTSWSVHKTGNTSYRAVSRCFSRDDPKSTRILCVGSQHFISLSRLTVHAGAPVCTVSLLKNLDGSRDRWWKQRAARGRAVRLVSVGCSDSLSTGVHLTALSVAQEKRHSSVWWDFIREPQPTCHLFLSLIAWKSDAFTSQVAEQRHYIMSKTWDTCGSMVLSGWRVTANDELHFYSICR